MRKLLLVFVVVACLLSFKCNSKTANGKSVTAGTPDNSANSLDWKGTYKGILPCAVCQGLVTELTLNGDNTYNLKTTYLGRDSIGTKEIGNFYWSKEGGIITLANGKNRPGKYLVGENKITQLDMNGSKITGALADNYVLTKQTIV